MQNSFGLAKIIIWLDISCKIQFSAWQYLGKRSLFGLLFHAKVSFPLAILGAKIIFWDNISCRSVLAW